jgi:SAM-dependent methyltransferase
VEPAFPTTTRRATTIDDGNAQTWDPERYDRNARFVSDLGSPVVELLAPRPGERILDLGCGDGVLTERLVALGCDVVGVDASAPQIEATRGRGLDARVMSGEQLSFDQEFDAVFSNAAMHWMRDADAVIDGVWRALRAGGRFVAEFGGAGCVEIIRTALITALNRRGVEGAAADPWYFPATPPTAATRTPRFRCALHCLDPAPDAVAGRSHRVAGNVRREFHQQTSAKRAQRVSTRGPGGDPSQTLRRRRQLDSRLRALALRGRQAAALTTEPATRHRRHKACAYSDAVYSCDES